MPRPITQGPYRTFRRLNQNESFLEFEGSTITVDLKARTSPNDPWMQEELKLRAFMRLEIFPAYINNLGTREFQFIIRDWWLHGKSEMLSTLFFGDPRGMHVSKIKKPGKKGPENWCDYVPAAVTFRVSNNYNIDVDDTGHGLGASELFASPRDLDIRNLTSHHTRIWDTIKERSDAPSYTLPGNRIYWQVLSADAANELGIMTSKARGPVVLFHKKPPERTTERGIAKTVPTFRASDCRERADFLLAIGEIGEDGRFFATTPWGHDGGRLEALSVQQHGNVTLSPHFRPISDIEIRWGLAKGLDLDRLSKQLGKAGSISGSIRIVSPSRSLGTAEQGPVGDEPIDSCDFPARITYAVNYNIAINRETFVEDQAGIAIAMGALEIPPRDVTVAFDKPHIGHVLQKYLEFGPGHCTGMHEIPEQEYEHGVNFCRYWRTVPLDPTDSRWGTFEDFDPDRVY